MEPSRTFISTGPNIREARDYVTAVFGDHPEVETARLLASELAGNAVGHGDGTDFTVAVDARADAVRVSVGNAVPGGLPPMVPRMRDSEDERGRGLGFVAAFSSAWGYEAEGRRVTVWFELAVVAVAV